mgnify:CR=1 FL=1
MHSYYKKILSWLCLDAACTYALLRFTAWATGTSSSSVALVSTLARVCVWATAYAPFEYYAGWTPLNVCVDDGTL